METLEYLVEQYQTQQKSKSDVIDQLEAWLKDESISEAEIIETLKALLEKQKISPDLFNDIFNLLQSLSGKTVIANDDMTAGFDQTQLNTTTPSSDTNLTNNNTVISTDNETLLDQDEQTILSANGVTVTKNTEPTVAADSAETVLVKDQSGTIISRTRPDYKITDQAIDVNQTAINTSSPAEKTISELDKTSNGRAKPIKTGSIIKDRFILKEVIGAGGMSIVFKALDLRKQEAKNKNPFVAIKVLGDVFKNHLQSLLVLERESQQIQKLAHPNIVTVYDFDRDGETIYMTMECLDGVSLDQIIAKHKNGLSYEETVKYVEGMCRGLAYAHSKQIIHSDFKPENVFYTKDKVVKILDFGIARAKRIPGSVEDQDEFDAGSLGALTPPYASCEMFENKDPDPRDDIYALGCVTYKLLTGMHPFDGIPANKARDKKLKPKRINHLNKRQWNTLEAALAFNREARIPTTVDFLNGFLPKKRSPWLYATAAALLVTISVAGYSWFTVSTQPELPQIKLTEDQKLSIADALDTADVYISMGYLASPPGDSALDQYDKILSIDPTNTQAIEGKKLIAVKYIEFAMEQLEKRDYDLSLNYIRTGLIVEPDNEKLKTLENEVKNLRANQ